MLPHTSRHHDPFAEMEPKAICNLYLLLLFQWETRMPMIPKNILNSKNPIIMICLHPDFDAIPLIPMLYLKSEYGMTSSNINDSWRVASPFASRRTWELRSAEGFTWMA